MIFWRAAVILPSCERAASLVQGAAGGSLVLPGVTDHEGRLSAGRRQALERGNSGR